MREMEMIWWDLSTTSRHRTWSCTTWPCKWQPERTIIRLYITSRSITCQEWCLKITTYLLPICSKKEWLPLHRPAKTLNLRVPQVYWTSSTRIRLLIIRSLPLRIMRGWAQGCFNRDKWFLNRPLKMPQHTKDINSNRYTLRIILCLQPRWMVHTTRA